MREVLLKLQSIVDELLCDRGALKVLDAGCGSDRYIRIPQNVATHIVGIDLSEEELQKNSLVDEKIVGDIESYKLPPSEFDLIRSWWVLEHLSHPEKALQNFSQSIKEDGLIILAVPNVFYIKGLITKYTPHRFHIWIHRMFSDFISFEGCEPFPTYLRFSISPSSILHFGLKSGMSIEYSILFEPKTLKELREKC